MSNEFIGGIALKIGDVSGSPHVYTPVENLTELPGFGETNPDVKTTNFDSDAQEYIAGLSDGSEFTITCSRTHESPSIQDSLIASKGTNLNLQIVHTDKSVSPNTTRTYTFLAVNKGWELDPQVEDKNSINFTFRVTGAIARSST